MVRLLKDYVSVIALRLSLALSCVPLVPLPPSISLSLSPALLLVMLSPMLVPALYLLSHGRKVPLKRTETGHLSFSLTRACFALNY